MIKRPLDWIRSTAALTHPGTALRWHWHWASLLGAVGAIGTGADRVCASSPCKQEATHTFGSGPTAQCV